MFETHFGLKKRPFRALAQGDDVFVGPQTAATAASIKKALAASDAIIAVTGPVGIGKTTLVGRAIQGISGKLLSVPVGRIKLAHDQVLELLLEQLGVENIPVGTVQRFTRFRRKLKELTDEGVRVVVQVEDAAHMGVDGLSELEALTAADAGVSEGAAVAIMGGPETDELLKVPALARLRQRLRWSKRVEPLNQQEMAGYFTHCFRAAGGDFVSIFASDAMPALHALSEGIPRIGNKIVEASMEAAAEKNQQHVSVELISEVARSQLGIDADLPVAAAPAPATESAAPVRPETEIETDELPELIQDTLPDLEVLAPQLTRRTVQKASTPPAPADSAPAVPDTASPAARELPDWERDPTLAELRPDLEALEHAMAVAHGADKDSEVIDEDEPPVLKPLNEQDEIVPQITLDSQIKAKIEEDAEEIRRTEAEAAAKAEEDKKAAKMIDIAATGEIAVGDLPPLPSELESAPEPEPQPEVTPQAAKPAPESQPEIAPQAAKPEPEPEPEPEESSSEMLEIAENLSKAKTIDDVDDKMAETLFGEEFSAIAAQVAAKAASELPANDDLELQFEDDQPLEEPAAVAKFNGAAAVSVTPGTKPPAAQIPSPALDQAASDRLATVRALNGAPNVAPPPPPSAESIVMTEMPSMHEIPAGTNNPDSIEDQITSMTQTMKTLKMPAGGFTDDDDDDEKKGFFSRFRK